MEPGQSACLPFTDPWVDPLVLLTLGVVMRGCGTNTWEEQAGGPEVQGYLQLHREFKARLRRETLS